MSGKKKIDYHEHDMLDQEKFPDQSNVASATECTGLMYRVPMNAGEMESYQRLSSMGIPKVEEEAETALQQKLHHAKTAKETGKAVEEATEGEYSPRHMKE